MALPYVLTTSPKNGAYVDLATYLLEHRTLFVGPELTAASASEMTMQMLALLQGDGEISVYINCYGGSVPAGLAIADVIDYANSQNRPVHTYCIGECIGVASVILASGAKGKRKAFPSARISLFQEWFGVESMWGATNQDQGERKRLLAIIKARLLHHTQIGTWGEEKKILYDEDAWEGLLARFPLETALPELAVESEGKYSLDTARIRECLERRELGEKVAHEILARASNRLESWLEVLEFLSPAQALRAGIIDGLVESGVSEALPLPEVEP